MSPVATFFSGLVILAVFIWYLITDLPRRKRVLGSILTVLAMAMALQAVYPPDEKINLGLDLQGGTSFLLRLEKIEGKEVDPKVLEQAVGVIRKRIDSFGVSEPIITPEGKDRILVQIPGLDTGKIEEARQQLQKVAKLEMRMVHDQNDQLIPQIEAGAAATPPGWTVFSEKIERGGKIHENKLLLRTEPDIKGHHIQSGYPFYDNHWGVGIQFTSEGGALFGKLTAANVGKRFAILLDDEIQSAPVINDAIYGGRASITGRFSEKEARTLASVLENPLAVPVKIAEERSVSSSLGADAIRSGIWAGLSGLALVFFFVVVYYRYVGFTAIFCLLINFILLVGIMAMFNVVLTLPGIAGLILTIGLAVDANILIFERLREELASGKSLKSAVEGAFSKAFSVIFDANATTLIMAGILFWYATGPVRGFAVVLTIGVITSVFSAMVVSRNLLEWSLRAGLEKVKLGQLIPDGVNINFLGRRRLWIFLSTLLLIAGVIAFAIRGEKNFGIDFKGGDLLVLEATGRQVSVDEVREVVKGIELGEIPIQKETEKTGDKEFITIRSPIDTADTILTELREKLPDATFTEHRRDTVGKLVGGELAESSLWALGLGMLGILIYVSARFEVSFAIGALVSLLHDIVLTVGIFALTGRELSLTLIGAILTIAGFSINDTIVVFDRIREGLQGGRKGSLEELMNASINETLSRTLLTSGLTFLCVLMLYIFGGAVLNDFAFTILVGIIVGTYSSIFIASTTVLWWAKRTGRDLAAEIRGGRGEVVSEG